MDANTQALLNIIQRFNQAQADQQSVAQFQRHQQQALIQHTQMMTANGTIPTTLSALLTQFPNTLPPPNNAGLAASTPQGIHFTPIPNVTVPTPQVYAATHGLPSHSGINVDMPLYYQQYLNQSIMCMCGCASACPVHDGNHPVLLPQQSTSTSLLGNHPLRHMIPSQQQPPPPQQQQQPQQRTSQSPTTQHRLLTQALVNRTRQYVEEGQIRMQHQQRQVHLASAIAAVASGSSSSQQQSLPQLQQQQPQPSSTQSTSSHHHRDSSIRQKRPATFGSDGRPSSKVRRVISMDGSTPSSSQLPTERFETSETSQSNSIIPTRAQSVFRVCSNCQQRFSTSSPPASLCPCHNSDNCPFTGSVCQLCIYNMLSTTPERSSQISSVVHQQILNNRNTHQQRQRDAANLFYQQNLYETPAPPAPASGVLVVNNRAPYMDILFFTPGESTVTGISGLPHLPSINPAGPYSQTTQQQIQTLHQVLSQNPHISEPPPIGATLDDIKKKTTIMNYTKDPNVPEEETERCTVCLSDFETGDEVRTLNCTHLFHTECIDRWLIYNKKCPVCRVEMDKPAGYGALCDLFRSSYEQVQQAQTAVASTNAAA